MQLISVQWFTVITDRTSETELGLLSIKERVYSKWYPLEQAASWLIFSKGIAPLSFIQLTFVILMETFPCYHVSSKAE